MQKKIKEIEKKEMKVVVLLVMKKNFEKYYAEKDEWKYRVITKEFIRTQMSGETGKITIYNIVAILLKRKNE